MNSSNANTTILLDPWVESGAMVYVALTVATFSAVMMCCTWFFKQRWLDKRDYNTLDREEHIELTSQTLDEDEEEEISLNAEEARSETSMCGSGDPSDEEEPGIDSFTFDDNDDTNV